MPNQTAETYSFLLIRVHLLCILFLLSDRLFASVLNMRAHIVAVYSSSCVCECICGCSNVVSSVFVWFLCSSVSLFLCLCASFIQLATQQTTCSLCGRQETRCKWTPSLCHSLTSDKKILIMGTAPNSMQEQVLYLS